MSNTLDENIGSYFVAGLLETIQTMTGFCLTEVKKIDYENNEIAAAMLLAGNINAMIMIKTSIATASTLVSYMTGMDLEYQTDSDIYDGIAELVNIVAGLAKARITDKDAAFMLTPPFAFVGEKIKLVTKKNVKRFEYQFAANDVELKLGIYYF